MMYYPPTGAYQPYAQNVGNEIKIFESYFGSKYNDDVPLNNGFRKSILHYEFNHKINEDKGKYPGGYMSPSIQTDIVFYVPYSEKEKKEYAQFNIPLNPLGMEMSFSYTNSNTVKEHRDVYQEQINGHNKGLYTITKEQIDKLQSNVDLYDSYYKSALKYEETNNLTPDGKPKQ